MSLIPKDRNSKQWKQFVAWLVGSLVMPFAAYPFVHDVTPDISFDLPVILVLGVSWALVSFFLYLYIKNNIH